jgi:ankyrin repeat protein
MDLDNYYLYDGLLRAANYGDIRRMKELLAQGADITERDKDGWGVLQYAGYDAQYMTMRWLLTEAGAIKHK